MLISSLVVTTPRSASRPVFFGNSAFWKSTRTACAFDDENVEAKRISENADYEGVLVTLVAYLERAKIPIQIDIGFGDLVTPAPSRTDYPTLLEFPGPRLLAYPKETALPKNSKHL